MTRNQILGVAVAVALAGGAIALWLGRSPADTIDGPDAAPTASVTVSAVRAQTLTDRMGLYGVVQADPTGSVTLAAPKALIVSRLLVQPGQIVEAGQALMEVANAPASDLAYAQAANAAAFAQADLARVQRLYDEHLAATDQLGAARRALADAQATLVSQHAQSTGEAHRVLTAPKTAIVTIVSVAPGDHVAQDAPLLVLSRRDALSVKLGLEPTMDRIRPGIAVTITPMSGGAPVASRLTMVGAVADPVTRNIPAVAPLSGVGFPIGSTVRAEVAVGEHEGLLAPRASVVFDETGSHLFVVENGKARRVFVTAGADFGDQIEVHGPLKAGDPVALQGAYELQDGMAVKVVRP